MRMLRTRAERRNHAGFTLVELLVVVGIIAILAALITPAIISAMHKAQETETSNLIHQVEIAAQAYFNDNGDYPPSTWERLFYPDPAESPQDPATGAWNNLNTGIEVLTACLATRNGGPYLEPGASQLGNTDDDVDVDGPSDPDTTADILGHTNYYFGSNDVFELVDYWGNPLVYVHNRNYANVDGWRDDLAPAVFEDPTAAGALEYVLYVDADDNTVPCYARWDNRNDDTGDPLITRNYPNLSSFQLYSWGPDLQPGCAPTTGAAGSRPNFRQPGVQPGWTAASRNLTSWQE